MEHNRTRWRGVRRGLAALAALATGAALTVAPQLSADAADQSVSGGDITWGVKQSFRNYITGGIAQGSVTFNDGAEENGGNYRWPSATGSYDPDTQSGQISVAGEVFFSGHHGILESTISDLRVVFDNGQATLVADVTSRPFTSMTDPQPPVVHDDVVLADLAGTPTVTGDQLSLTAEATLTAEGAPAFGGMYPADTALDAVNLNVTLDEVADGGDDDLPTQQPTTQQPTQRPASQQPTTQQPTQQQPTTQQPTQAPATQQPAAQQPATQQPTQAPSSAAPKRMCTVPATSTGTLSWGVKSSFRSYISGGIAKGGWNLTGTTYSGDRFHWTLNKADLAGTTGTLSYNGGVRFTGHEGVLDMQITNVRVKINSANSATLIADVASSDMSGAKSSKANVAFANLGGTITVADGQASGSNLSAALTADGAAAFAGFYEAGAELDPVSFSTKAGEAKTVECDENGKPVGLPKTGGDVTGAGLGDGNGAAAAAGIFAAAALLALAARAARRSVTA